MKNETTVKIAGETERGTALCDALKSARSEQNVKAEFYNAVGIGEASPAEIDEINILNASFLAMRRAIENLSVKPDFALIDGNSMKNLPCPFELIVKGDQKSLTVAAASVLAKVSRDRFMDKIDKEYPQYMFSKHKGYGTKLHYEMLEKYGACPYHRQSFRLFKNQ